MTEQREMKTQIKIDKIQIMIDKIHIIKQIALNTFKLPI